MKYFLTILLLLPLFSFSQHRSYADEDNPRLHEIVNEFMLEANERCFEIDLKVTEIYYTSLLKRKTLGVCIPLFVNCRLILINSDREYTPAKLEQLVFHELGHCELGLGHDNSQDSSGCPLSIMHEDEFMCGYWMRREEILDKFFNQTCEDEAR